VRSNTNKKRSTLADVAAAAGVSKMTASRALRGAGDVSPANIEKVRQKALEIGYVGNHVASSLSGQQSPLVGVVVPTLENIVFAEVVTGIAEALAGTSIQPFFGVTDYRLEKEYEIIRAMLSWNPTGIIITGLDQPEKTQSILRASGVPVVQIMDSDGTPIDHCVGFSQFQAGATMAKHLIESGRSLFGYVGGDIVRDTRAGKRLAGFESELEKQGLALLGKKIGEGGTSVAKGRAMTKQLIDELPNLDCIYFSNDDMATGGALHCMAKGIDVGSELALVGFNGLEILNDLPVPISTSYTPRREIGRAAVEVLLNDVGSSSTSGQILTQFVPSIKLGEVVD